MIGGSNTIPYRMLYEYLTLYYIYYEAKVPHIYFNKNSPFFRVYLYG